MTEEIQTDTEEMQIDWSAYDGYEFQGDEIFTGEYPPQAAEWCNENGTHYIVEIEPDETGKPRYQIQPIPEPTEEEIAQFNAMLSLTAADVERAIYKAKGMDFDDVIALVEQYNQTAPMNEDGEGSGLDIKALKIELKANNFYRGSEWVITVGAMLGFTPKQLDLFFEDGNYEHLISSTEN